MSPRPDKHENWLTVAHTIAARGTCKRRRVGCVLVDDRNCILSTGFNGPGPGQPHCIDQPCAGANFASGQGLGECEAIHAEQNALLTCQDIFTIAHVYTTTAPCKHCTKMLLRTSAQAIYFIDDYVDSGQELWERAGRRWIMYSNSQIELLRYFSVADHRVHGGITTIQANMLAESLVRVE